MAFGIGRGMTAPLMVINFCLYFIAACLAGSILNRNLDANMGQTNNPPIGNVVTPVFIPIVLIACMAGLASVFAGAHHLRLWRTESLAAAAATSLIAWLLTLLAMGLACKEIHTRYGRSKRLVSQCRDSLCTDQEMSPLETFRPHEHVSVGDM
jgi:hypothetical protein